MHVWRIASVLPAFQAEQMIPVRFALSDIRSLDCLRNLTSLFRIYWQHRTIWQEHSAKDFASYESYKRAGILYVFPPFITARMGQKIGRRPQTQLCGDAIINEPQSDLYSFGKILIFSR